MFKLELEKAEEPEIKLSTSVGSSKEQESSSKTSTSAFDCVHHSKLWEILKEMGIPDHLTCLLRSLCAGQEATVRSRHGTTDRFQIGEGVGQDCIETPGWMKRKLESRLQGEISITSDMQMTPPLWQKVKRN